jgi:hypothetical protein
MFVADLGGVAPGVPVAGSKDCVVWTMEDISAVFLMEVTNIDGNN